MPCRAPHRSADEYHIWVAMRLSYQRPAALDDVQPLIAQLEDELGPEFERSMRAWFGLEPRPYAFDAWEVFVAHEEGGTSEVGVCGYYRQQGDRPGRFWVGWLGVVPRARRQGVGAQLLNKLTREVTSAGGRELWVYTEPDNRAAAAFYLANGMLPQGPFADLGLPQAAASPHSITFSKTLG